MKAHLCTFNFLEGTCGRAPLPVRQAGRPDAGATAPTGRPNGPWIVARAHPRDERGRRDHPPASGWRATFLENGNTGKGIRIGKKLFFETGGRAPLPVRQIGRLDAGATAPAFSWGGAPVGNRFLGRELADANPVDVKAVRVTRGGVGEEPGGDGGGRDGAGQGQGC